METIIEHSRFKDAPWYALAQTSKIVVGGAGGIGSWLTLLLARTGMKCYIFDDDKVERHNLGGQLYSSYQVGMPKVLAVSKVMGEFAPNATVRTFDFKIDESTKVGLIVASCFDNMLARKHLFDAWCTANLVEHVEEMGEARKITLKLKEGAMFIDGRLEAENMMVFCVNKIEDIDKYLEELKLTDADIEEAECTYKQTSFAAAMIASHMTGFIINHLANVATGRDSRKVPYQWEYFVPLNS